MVIFIVHPTLEGSDDVTALAFNARRNAFMRSIEYSDDGWICDDDDEPDSDEAAFLETTGRQRPDTNTGYLGIIVLFPGIVPVTVIEDMPTAGDIVALIDESGVIQCAARVADEDEAPHFHAKIVAATTERELDKRFNTPFSGYTIYATDVLVEVKTTKSVVVAKAPAPSLQMIHTFNRGIQTAPNLTTIENAIAQFNEDPRASIAIAVMIPLTPLDVDDETGTVISPIAMIFHANEVETLEETLLQPIMLPALRHAPPPLPPPSSIIFDSNANDDANTGDDDSSFIETYRRLNIAHVIKVCAVVVDTKLDNNCDVPCIAS